MVDVPNPDGGDELDNALKNAESGAEQNEAIERNEQISKQMESLAREFASYGVKVSFYPPSGTQLLDGSHPGRLHVLVGVTDENEGGYHTYESDPDNPGEIRVRLSRGKESTGNVIIANNFGDGKILTMGEAVKNGYLGIAETVYAGGNNNIKPGNMNKLPLWRDED